MEVALGLLALDRADEGLDIVNRTIDIVRESGELFQLPELLARQGRAAPVDAIT